MSDAVIAQPAAAAEFNYRKLYAAVATYGVLFFALAVILFPIF